MTTDPMAELPAELKQNMTRYKAPPGLQRRIRYTLAQQARGNTAGRRAAWLWRWLPMGASFACGALLAVSIMSIGPAETAPAQMEQQVVASHVRSLMGSHVTDVASTDQHTVKPWFTGKLDYAPTVINLAEDGFPLVGGRLDYLHKRPVAALVYQRRSHTINVFVLPAGPGAPPLEDLKLAVDHGFQLAHWTRGQMTFWAISDLGRDELVKFATAMRTAPAL